MPLPVILTSYNSVIFYLSNCPSLGTLYWHYNYSQSGQTLQLRMRSAFVGTYAQDEERGCLNEIRIPCEREREKKKKLKEIKYVL